MRYLSVCSGIEAASVAWHPLGWTPVGFSEIEPFPCSVLAHRFPNVPNYGDMTTIAARIDSGEIEAPDILVGGTPCQAFSVAGKRESLNDERGGLSLAFIRIADAIDRRRRTLGLRPCIIVWENVPGVLSTKDNAFGHFLAGIAGEDEALVAPGGRWTDAGCVCGPKRNAAWRILCAQWFGLAQRRERVLLVASAGAFDPGAVLLEWEGVRRDSAPSREAREGTAADAGCGAAFGRGNQSGSIDVATACNAHGVRLDFDSETLVTHSLRADGFDASEDGTGRGTPIVPVGGSHWDSASNAHPTLNQSASSSGGIGASNQEVFSQRGGGIVPQAVPYDLYQITAPINRQSRKDGDPCHTLARDNAAHAAVVQPIAWDEELSASVGVSGPVIRGGDGGRHAGVAVPMAVQQNQLGEVRTGDVAGMLNQNFNASGRNTPLVAFPIDTQNMSEGHNSGGLGFGQEGDPMFTLGRAHSHAVAHGIDVYNHAETGDVDATLGANSGGTTTAGPKVLAFGWQNSESQGDSISEHLTPTLDKSKTPAIAFTCKDDGRDAGEVSPTLRSMGHSNSHPNGGGQVAVTGPLMRVRRLVPTETEVLQGFPRGWTNVPHRGKPAADGPRYKAIGNSMAVNVMAWIGSRIDRHARGDI